MISSTQAGTCSSTQEMFTASFLAGMTKVTVSVLRLALFPLSPRVTVTLLVAGSGPRGVGMLFSRKRTSVIASPFENDGVVAREFSVD
jgi:hypothetical protein